MYSSDCRTQCMRGIWDYSGRYTRTCPLLRKILLVVGCGAATSGNHLSSILLRIVGWSGWDNPSRMVRRKSMRPGYAMPIAMLAFRQVIGHDPRFDVVFQRSDCEFSHARPKWTGTYVSMVNQVFSDLFV